MAVTIETGEGFQSARLVNPDIAKVNGRRSVTEARAAIRERLRDAGQFEGVWLPIEVVNVLPQPRKTFEKIDELADSIAREKIINPPSLVALDEENATEYLRVINKVQKTDIKLEDLAPVEEGKGKRWIVLIAGERRFRALTYLREHGCSDCQTKASEQDSEEGDNTIRGCYSSHFEREDVEFRLGRNISARNALNKQSAENMHMRVPPHEDATFLYNYWLFIKDEDPNYPLAAFAKDAGRSESTIRDAVKYCNLPEIVKNRVEQPEKEGRIPYGVAIEIARLLEIRNPTTVIEMNDLMDFNEWIDLDVKGRTITGGFYKLSEEELLGWVNKYIIGNYKLPEFRELVANYISEKEAGQTSIFDIMSDNQMAQFERQQKRIVVEKNSIRFLHGAINYCTILLMLTREGKLSYTNIETSPFSNLEMSPLRQ